MLSRQQSEAETENHQHQPEKDEVPQGKELTSSPAKPENILEIEIQDASEEDEDDLVDDEIIEIFVEEATEVLETITEFLPRWIDNEDGEALAEIRRAFHTLKGSGRMVGAADIGEFGWAIENMLNRLVDGTKHTTRSRQQVIQQSIGIIPGIPKNILRHQTTSNALCRR